MNNEVFYLRFKKYKELIQEGPVMAEKLTDGTTVGMSENLKNLGCPMDLQDALSWLASHRSLQLTHRTEIRQADGVLVVITLKSRSFITDKSKAFHFGFLRPVIIRNPLLVLLVRN